MNNFQAKYIKISSDYLNDKLSKLNVVHQDKDDAKSKERSSLKKFVANIFK